uniref:Uncharacterized protein n=1 Tax=Setaria viridis TaxID=4556 RepID=A0A4U6U097_SETVI|nr:hypothetical protein SEVIR_6G053200v2 [Setaria viridis]
MMAFVNCEFSFMRAKVPPCGAPCVISITTSSIVGRFGFLLVYIHRHDLLNLIHSYHSCSSQVQQFISRGSNWCKPNHQNDFGRRDSCWDQKRLARTHEFDVGKRKRDARRH